AAPDCTVCGAPAVAIGAATGASTVTVVVAVVVNVPWFAAYVKCSVTDAAPGASVGAVNVAVAVVAPASVTGGVSAACVQATVSDRGGVFASPARPSTVPAAPDCTVCGAPAVAIGAATGASTVTVVVAVVVNVPLFALNVKCSVTDAAPGVNVGAVNVAVAVFAPASVTVGVSAACVQATVSDRGGVFGSLAVP